MSLSGVLYPLQAVFRAGHRPLAVLPSVLDDLLLPPNHNQATALILLVLSAAFVTVDFSIFSLKLAVAGITYVALKWLLSFLGQRGQSVSMGTFFLHLLYLF